ncbi:hypothetical protein AAFF_G00097740 [Aldrovandia affinis]|uniref:Uncharacterized protein n=1 Tax=Aldrovandia affinis TaxID=143900 RepID=A0AAD7RXW1_9TELE|nr:hypothetical protein AAFF_G00097740 [Aldrovandia affinis]
MLDTLLAARANSAELPPCTLHSHPRGTPPHRLICLSLNTKPHAPQLPTVTVVPVLAMPLRLTADHGWIKQPRVENRLTDGATDLCGEPGTEGNKPVGRGVWNPQHGVVGKHSAAG